jgi:hypothetical protein
MQAYGRELRPPASFASSPAQTPSLTPSRISLRLILPESWLPIQAGTKVLREADFPCRNAAMLEQLPKFVRDNYVCKEWRHASSILMTDFGDLFCDVVDVLSRFKLKKSDIVVGGGSKTKIADWIDTELTKKGWVEEEFTTRVRVERDQKNFREYESPTHKVDCFKANKNGGVGFEIEWNNKDPFFDRDLNNFRLLFELRTVSVGIILTRSEELNAVLKELVRKKLKPKSAFGESTTHWGKLLSLA